jgi:site-specific DNA-methyltransferase (adenine-specific)
MNGEYIYLNSFELAVWFKKSKATFNAFCKHNLFNTSIGSSKIFPTQKNLKLFKEIILDNTNKGDVILDPCIGSGTTAIACLDTDRNYMGFEVDNISFNSANNRTKEYLIKNHKLLI